MSDPKPITFRGALPSWSLGEMMAAHCEPSEPHSVVLLRRDGDKLIEIKSPEYQRQALPAPKIVSMDSVAQCTFGPLSIRWDYIDSPVDAVAIMCETNKRPVYIWQGEAGGRGPVVVDLPDPLFEISTTGA